MDWVLIKYPRKQQHTHTNRAQYGAGQAKKTILQNYTHVSLRRGGAHENPRPPPLGAVNDPCPGHWMKLGNVHLIFLIAKDQRRGQLRVLHVDELAGHIAGD